MDDRFVVTDDEGKTIGKAGFVEELCQLSMVFQAPAHDVIRIHGDTAVSVGTTTVRFRAAGTQDTHSLR